MGRTAMVICGAVLVGVGAGDAFGQIGRRFEIKVVEGKLVAQGYIGGEGSGDDGGGLVRAHTNAIHHHWRNDFNTGIAHAELPGMDIIEPGELVGHDVYLTVLGGKKWVDGGEDPAEGTVIEWSALEQDETILVRLGDQKAGTSHVKTIVLAEDIGAEGAVDVGIFYEVKQHPRDQVMVVEAVLSTDAPGVEASDPVYLIFPPARQMHLTALYVEGQVGTAALCEGDANGDGVVDVNDISHVLFRLGPCE